MSRNFSSDRFRIDPQREEALEAFVRTLAIPLRLIDSRGRVLWRSDYFKSRGNFCSVLRTRGFPYQACQRAHKEAIRESIRWGEAILTRCCSFVMQITAPVMKKKRSVAALVASPFLLVNPSELEAEEVAALYKGPGRSREPIEKALSGLAVVKDEGLRQSARELFQLANHLSDPDLGHLMQVREAQALQGEIAEQIADLKNLDREFTPDSMSKLFYEREKEIITKIRLGDRGGARKILHQLLAIVLVQYLENFELLKISILELLVILSRAAAEAGAKIEEILGMRYRFVTELSSIHSQEDLCLWVVRIFEKLTDRIYETRHHRNYQRLKAALDFIESHYRDRLSVERIAQEACLSPSRLSHIVKSELGITLTEYLSRVRIRRAKALLLEKDSPLSQVALEVGYPDQSYFTKVFKKVEGYTPKTFKQKHLESTP